MFYLGFDDLEAKIKHGMSRSRRMKEDTMFLIDQINKSRKMVLRWAEKKFDEKLSMNICKRHRKNISSYGEKAIGESDLYYLEISSGDSELSYDCDTFEPSHYIAKSS